MSPPHDSPEGIQVTSDDFAYRLGFAVGCALRRQHMHRDGHPVVILAKNTARENYATEPLFVSRLVRAGMRVIQTGPIPLPSLASLTPSMRADLGIFISGGRIDGARIRFFAGKSWEAGATFEDTVEELLRDPDLLTRVEDPPPPVGDNVRIEDAHGRCIEHAKARVPRDGVRLESLRVALDCANGAVYKAAPAAFHELGMEVRAFNVTPNGHNLVVDCGYYNPKPFGDHIQRLRADLGVAFNGDGDGVRFFDSKGKVIEENKIVELLDKGFGAGNWETTDRFVQSLQVLYAFEKARRPPD